MYHTLYQQHNTALIKNGYDIIPLAEGCKYPRGLSNWQSIAITPANVKKWGENPIFTGIGIRTANTPAIDIDITAAALAAEVSALVLQRTGCSPSRIGQAPKILFLYRTDAPFSKLVTSKYSVGKVEILADGQQFAAYHIHPDTEEPYFWPDEDIGLSPLDMSSSELPVLTEEVAQALIVDIDKLMASKGYQPITPQSTGTQKTGAIDKESLDFTSDFLSSPANVKKIENALRKLDPDEGYGAWVETGMSLYHSFAGKATGLKLWDEWSRASIVYDADELVQKWGTFKRDIGTTNLSIASVFARAKDVPRAHERCDDTDPLVTDVTTLDDMLERYVFVLNAPFSSGACAIYDTFARSSEFFMTAPSFNALLASKNTFVPRPTKSNPTAIAKIKLTTEWLESDKRRTISTSAYYPSQARIIRHPFSNVLAVNTGWMPDFSETADVDITVFLDHVRYLCNDERDSQWLMQWIAYCVQNLDKRCNVVPLHISRDHGTGRGWLYRLFGRMLGFSNCQKPKLEMLVNGAFQDFLSDSVMCFVDEAKSSNVKNYEISDSIRDMLIDPELDINNKYGKKGLQRVYASMCIFTNNFDAIKIQEEDRRFSVLNGPSFVQPNAYYKRLYAEVERNDFVGSVFRYLKQLDISSFNDQRAPLTVGREMLINNTRSDTEKAFYDYIKASNDVCLTAEQLTIGVEAVMQEAGTDQYFSLKQCNSLIRRECKNIRVKINKKVMRLWQIDPRAVHTNDEIRIHYLEYLDNKS